MTAKFCSICREKGSDFITRCKHEFHLNCVSEFINKQKSCPYCWKRVTSDQELENLFMDLEKLKDKISNMDAQTLLNYLNIFEFRYINSFEAVIIRLKELNWDFNQKLNNGETILHLACHGEHVKSIRLITEYGCNIDATDSNGDTPLSLTSFNGILPLVTELVDCGANLKTELPIFRAVETSRFYIMNFILERNPEALHYRDQSGRTLLHHAAKHSNKRMINHLIDMGADISAKDLNGNSILHDACLSSSQHSSFNYLLKLGLNPNEKNFNGDTPLMYAMMTCYPKYQMRKLLKYGGDLTLKNKQNQDSIYFFLNNRFDLMNTGILPLFSKFRVNLNVIYDDGTFPLAIAAKLKAFGIVKRFLELGADPNLCNSNGEDALFFACTVDNNLQIIKLLLKAGCDTYLKDKRPRNMPSVLHIAYKHHDINLINLLLEKRADINEQNENGETILHLAVKDENMSLVDYFISKKADLNCENYIGLTPKAYARTFQMWTQLNSDNRFRASILFLFPCFK